MFKRGCSSPITAEQHPEIVCRTHAQSMKVACSFQLWLLYLFFFLVYNNFVSNTDTQKSRANTRVYPNIKLIHNNTATTVVYTIEYIGILLQVTTGTCDYSRVTGSF